MSVLNGCYASNSVRLPFRKMGSWMSKSLRLWAFFRLWFQQWLMSLWSWLVWSQMHTS